MRRRHAKGGSAVCKMARFRGYVLYACVATAFVYAVFRALPSSFGGGKLRTTSELETSNKGLLE